MTDNSSHTKDAEIDVDELFWALWAGKWLIAVTLIAAAALGALFFATAEEKYTATAVFALENGNNNGIPTLFAEPANFLLGAAGDNQGIFDRLEGRDFVLRLAENLDLNNDVYFNPPIQVNLLSGAARLFPWLGSKETTQLAVKPTREEIEEAIISAYLENVSISETKNKSIRISVRHLHPEQSARIANGIVDQVIREIESEERASHRSQLSYLSEQLADALEEVEAAKNAVAQSSLLDGRISMDLLRRQERIAEESYNALVEQVKVKSLSMNYPGEMAKIYQTAPVPQSPSFPSLPLIIAVSVALGSVVSIGFALLFIRWRGKVYSASTIARMSDAQMAVSTSALPSLRRQKRLWSPATYDRVRDPALFELAAAMLSSGKSTVLVSSSGLRISPLPLALWIANACRGSGYSTSLVLIEGQSNTLSSRGRGAVEESFGDVHIIRVDEGSPANVLTSLSPDRVEFNDVDKCGIRIVVASGQYAATAARCLGDTDQFSVLVARTGHSERKTIEKIARSTTIDALVNLK